MTHARQMSGTNYPVIMISALDNPTTEAFACTTKPLSSFTLLKCAICIRLHLCVLVLCVHKWR